MEEEREEGEREQGQLSLSSAIAHWRKKKRLFPSNVEQKRKEEEPAYSTVCTNYAQWEVPLSNCGCYTRYGIYRIMDAKKPSAKS